MKFPFFSKKKPEASTGRGYVPTERVKELTFRGFSEIDIIDVLRKEGFSPVEIDRALNQATRASVEGRAPPPTPAPRTAAPAPQYPPQQAPAPTAPAPTFPPQRPREAEALPTLPTLEQLAAPQREMPTVPETSLPSEYGQEYPTEEYIDYVVQEQFQDYAQQINEFMNRYKALEQKMNDIRNQLNVLSQARTGEQQQVINKIESFKDAVDELNARISGLEKAFKETLPALIESVRALSDLVQRLKREV